MTVRPLPYLLALALGVGVAGLAACAGSGSSRARIPSADAGRLSDDFDAVAAAVDAGDCTAAARGVGQARSDVDSLPRRVSARLRARLTEGVDRLAEQAPRECLQARTRTETQPTVTEPTVTTAPPTTPTQTVPPTTTETTPAPTTPTTPAPTTPSTTPSGTGGAATP